MRYDRPTGSKRRDTMNRLCRATVILLTITLAACAGFRPVPPEIQLSTLEISDISLSHANFLATLRRLTRV